MHVVIIGAGIVGASIAFHLARQDAQVTIIEARQPGSGTSGATFACLNVFGTADPVYADIRARAIAYQSRLAQELRLADALHLSATLRWSRRQAGAVQLEENAKRLRDVGLAVETLAPRTVLADLEPDLAFADVEGPVFRVVGEGWSEPKALIDGLLRGAAEHGAAIRAETRVLAGQATNDGVTLETNAGAIAADVAVIAAGPDSAAVGALFGLNLPVEIHPGVVLTAPRSARLSHVVYADEVHFRPHGGDRILAGRSGHRQAPPPTADEQRLQAAAIARDVGGWIGDGRPLTPDSVLVGRRCVPSDGLPIAGYAGGRPNLYVVATHGGITLGPWLGEQCSRDLLSHGGQPSLAAFRPDRFDAADNAKRGASA